MSVSGLVFAGYASLMLLTSAAVSMGQSPAPRGGAWSDGAAKREPASLGADEFVRVERDQLVRGGKTVRFWGAQGNLVAPTHADIDFEVKLLKEGGFNLYRFGSHHMAPWVGPNAYTPGDNSATDRTHYVVAACGRENVGVWMVALGSVNWGRLAVNDPTDDPTTYARWREAMDQMLDPKHKGGKNFRLAAVFDPRLQAIWRTHIRGVLNEVNPYTGLRYADDPAIVTWEISNEMWAGARLLWGNHLELPRYFQDQIQAQWTAWLTRKYKSQQVLEAAWGGVLPGEQLTAGNVLMLPLDNRKPISPEIIVYGVNVKLTPAEANGENLSEARARDVRAFIIESVRALKTDLITVARGEGKAGIGISVVPIVADTEFNGTTVSLWQNMTGSATTPSLYHDLSGGDKNSPRYPWYSGLYGVPTFNDWFDDKRVRGKPTLVYEAMIWQPQKYAAEFPWRAAVQGAVQDMSIVDFHYYGHPLPSGSTDKSALEQQAIATVSTTRLPDGLIYRSNPVLSATFRAAGEVFARGYLKPAPTPVTLVLGRKSLESLDNVKGNDEAIRATAYVQGFRYDFDPRSEEDRVEGQLTDPASVPATFSPTAGLVYDTANGRMIIDVPEAKAVIGNQAAEHQFGQGVRVSGIHVQNPPGMPYVIDGERYAAISLVSLDDQALDKSRRILVTAAGVAFNTGFEFDEAKRGEALNDATNFAKSIKKRGTAPVLHSRVGCSFEAEWLKGKTAVFTDRFGKEIARRELADGRLEWDSNLPIYEVLLIAK